MAELGSYDIPKELKDEDKWFRYFTKRQLAYVGAGILIDALMLSALSKIGLFEVGLALAELVLIVAFIIAFGKIPEDRYLMGGGYNASTIILRLISKKLPKNKVIYVNNYDNYDRED